MAQMRVIRRRIRSVENTRQITRTMEMVATAKIKRAQERIEAARPYAVKMMEVLLNVSRHVRRGDHPLLEVREPANNVIIVVLTSNRGLAGAFNTNIIRRSEAIFREEAAAGRDVKFVAVGRKGLRFLRYNEYPVVREYTDIGDAPTFDQAAEIATDLMERYSSGEVDKIHIVFNHFRSIVDQKVVDHLVLPIEQEEMAETEAPVGPSAAYVFEPEAEDVLRRLLPVYIETLVYRTLLESVASEQGARRTAMKAATDNAGEMIESLKRTFNRARQAQITQEISEIVGGAEALMGAEATSQEV